MLEAGTNLRIIQSLLGHRSIQTTSRYTHLVKPNPDLAQSPLATLLAPAPRPLAAAVDQKTAAAPKILVSYVMRELETAIDGLRERRDGLLLRKGGLAITNPRPMPMARSFLLVPSDGPPGTDLLATVEEILEVRDLAALTPYRRLLHISDEEIARRINHPSGKGAWLWHVVVAPLRAPMSLTLDDSKSGVIRLSPPIEVELAPATTPAPSPRH